MQRLEIDLFGELRMRLDGAPWRFSVPPKCLPLLALLLLDAEPKHRQYLAATLWPEESERDARANLRRHLHALTKALPEIEGVAWIEANASAVRWNPSAPAAVDIRDFLQMAASRTTWVEATQLYRGELLAGVFDEAIIGPRERLASRHIMLLADLGSAALARRDYPGAIAHAGALLAIDEWREDMVRLLMLSRNATGDRSGALATFERFARRLREALRTDPMFETLTLRDAILAATLPTESDTGPPDTPAGRELIGRTAEVSALRTHWLRAARGGGTTAFISGEAGIGKSRLAHELQIIVESQGGRAVLGRTSTPEAMPYQPVVEALRQSIPFVKAEARDERWLAALEPLVPEVRRLRDRLPELAELEATRARLRLHDAFARAFVAYSRIRPLALIFEDVHLAQSDTVDAIGALADELRSAPILLVVTYRSSDAAPDSPVRALRRRLARASQAHHLSLGRLGPDEVRAIVTSAGSEGRDSFAEDVYRVSEGNPLFVWQLIRNRLERGDAADAPPVQTVSEAIRGRLEHMAPETRAVAEVAATIGDTFTVEEIAEVGGWSESSVFAALADLLDRQLVGERAGASFEYGFTHALIRGAVYDASAAEARTMRHRRSADVLAQTRMDRGGVLPLVAQHWLLAGQRDRARTTFLQAAQAALASYARAETCELVRSVLDLNPPASQRFAALSVFVAATYRDGDATRTRSAVDELEAVASELGAQQRCEALVARIQFHDHRSERSAQEVSIGRLAAFAREHARRDWEIEAILQRSRLAMQRGATKESGALLVEFGRPAEIMDPKQRYRYHSQLAQSLFRQGCYHEAQQQLAEFREYLTRHPSLEGESAFANAEHKGSWVTEDLNYIKRTANRVIELAELRGDLLAEAAGRIDLAVVRHQEHDTAAARLEFARTIDLYARVGQWQGWADTRINLGVCEREVGHFDRALKHWAEAREKAVELGVIFPQIVVDLNRCEVELYRGNPAAALELARTAFELVVGTGERRLAAEAAILLGAAERAMDDADGFAHFAQGLDLSRGMAQARSLAWHLTLYVEALIDAADHRLLPNALAELEIIANEDPLDHQFPGYVFWTLARGAALLGDRERERGFLDQGREVVEARLSAFTDQGDRAAFAAMHPNDELLSRNRSIGGAPAVRV